MTTPRIKEIAGDDGTGPLLESLAGLAVRGLPAMRTASGDYVFTRRGTSGGRAEPVGTSLRYAAIVALGVGLLPADAQRAALAGETAYDLVDRLVRTLTRTQAVTDLGTAALVCWAAAEARHQNLAGALAHLAELDPPGGTVYTVDAAWVVSALAAARSSAQVEIYLTRARRRLLSGTGARGIYPHTLGGRGLVPRYRAHVGCFADQVYPIQALARLHASWPDPPALAAAEAVADRICALQGAAGQWWWHYNARTGTVVEGYPVYSVHQHAMAPMALLDLAEAGGTRHDAAIRAGLHWLTAPEELAAGTGGSLIDDDLALVWRKVARNDPRKLVRGLRALSTRARSGAAGRGHGGARRRLAPLDHVFPPTVVDRECRPYELGWLLYAWHTSLEG
jgi:hypothetical protein